MEDLKEISRLIKTQDNRITDQPMFLVQRLERIYGMDSDYAEDYVWTDGESEADDCEAATLDALEKSTEDTGEYYKCYYIEEWRFVTACFTEAGCEDYISRMGHRHSGKLRIYADGSYRNYEYQAVRNHLISLTV